MSVRVFVVIEIPESVEFITHFYLLRFCVVNQSGTFVFLKNGVKNKLLLIVMWFIQEHLPLGLQLAQKGVITDKFMEIVVLEYV